MLLANLRCFMCRHCRLVALAASWRELMVGDPLIVMADYTPTAPPPGQLLPVLLERVTAMMCWTTIELQTSCGMESL